MTARDVSTAVTIDGLRATLARVRAVLVPDGTEPVTEDVASPAESVMRQLADEVDRVRVLDARCDRLTAERDALRVEAARPRPRVEWTAPIGGWTEAHVVGARLHYGPVALAVAPLIAEQMTDAGFDVDEVPRG